MRRAGCHPSEGVSHRRKKCPVVVVTSIFMFFQGRFKGFGSYHHLGSKFLRVSVAVVCLAPAGIFAWEVARPAWPGGIWKRRLEAILGVRHEFDGDDGSTTDIVYTCGV